MNKKSLLIIASIFVGLGISAFLYSDVNNTSEVLLVEEDISKIHTSNVFSEPTTIAQSMKAAQPAPNVTIGDDGKIYVLYQDTVDDSN